MSSLDSQCQATCYGQTLSAGPPRDATFKNLAVDRAVVTCLRSVISTTCGSIVAPLNLNVYVAPTTATPPGNDANSGLSFAEPVLTFERAFEIVRANGYDDTATIHLASGTYPLGVDGEECVNATPGVLGSQCQPVTVQGYESNVVASGVAVTAATQNATASSLYSATLAVDAADVQIGDVVTFSATGERAHITGVRAAGVGTVRVEFAVATPVVVADGTATVTRIDATSGSTIQVTGNGFFTGWKNAVHFRDVRLELLNDTVGGVAGTMRFQNLQTLFNNVVFVDADAATPGSKIVSFEGTLLRTGAAVYGDGESEPVGVAPDYAGLTIDGSNAGTIAAGSVEITLVDSKAICQNYVSHRGNIKAAVDSSANVVAGVATENVQTWLAETKCAIALFSVDYVDGPTGTDCILMTPGAAFYGIGLDMRSDGGAGTTPTNALNLTMASAVLNNTNIQGAGATGFGFGVSANSTSKLALSQVWIDNTVGAGLYVNATSSLVASTLAVGVTNGCGGSGIFLDGSSSASIFGLAVHECGEYGVLVEHSSTLSIRDTSFAAAPAWFPVTTLPAISILNNAQSGLQVGRDSNVSVRAFVHVLSEITGNGESNVFVYGSSTADIVIGQGAASAVVLDLGATAATSTAPSVWVRDMSTLNIVGRAGPLGFGPLAECRVSANQAAENILIENDSALNVRLEERARFECNQALLSDGIVVRNTSSLNAVVEPGTERAEFHVNGNGATGVEVNTGSTMSVTYRSINTVVPGPMFEFNNNNTAALSVDSSKLAVKIEVDFAGVAQVVEMNGTVNGDGILAVNSTISLFGSSLSPLAPPGSRCIEVSNNGTQGCVFERQTNARVAGVQIDSNGDDGMLVEDNSKAYVERCTVSQNGASGVRVTNNSSVTLNTVDSALGANSAFGLFMVSMSSALVGFANVMSNANGPLTGNAFDASVGTLGTSPWLAPPFSFGSGGESVAEINNAAAAAASCGCMLVSM